MGGDGETSANCSCDDCDSNESDLTERIAELQRRLDDARTNANEDTAAYEEEIQRLSAKDIAQQECIRLLSVQVRKLKVQLLSEANSTARGHDEAMDDLRRMVAVLEAERADALSRLSDSEAHVAQLSKDLVTAIELAEKRVAEAGELRAALQERGNASVATKAPPSARKALTDSIPSTPAEESSEAAGKKKAAMVPKTSRPSSRQTVKAVPTSGAVPRQVNDARRQTLSVSQQQQQQQQRPQQQPKPQQMDAGRRVSVVPQHTKTTTVVAAGRKQQPQHLAATRVQESRNKAAPKSTEVTAKATMAATAPAVLPAVTTKEAVSSGPVAGAAMARQQALVTPPMLGAKAHGRALALSIASGIVDCIVSDSFAVCQSGAVASLKSLHSRILDEKNAEIRRLQAEASTIEFGKREEAVRADVLNEVVAQKQAEIDRTLGTLLTVLSDHGHIASTLDRQQLMGETDDSLKGVLDGALTRLEVRARNAEEQAASLEPQLQKVRAERDEIADSLAAAAGAVCELEASRERVAELERKYSVARDEVMRLRDQLEASRTFLGEYKQRAVAKVGTLKSNLAKSEGELAVLDDALGKVRAALARVRPPVPQQFLAVFHAAGVAVDDA